MTTYTDHGLACLGEEDYAAVALAMQHDALATEAALDAVSDAFDTYYQRPYATAVTTGATGPVSSAGESIFGIGSWSLSNTNMAGATAVVNVGLRLTMPETGWYSYQAYANMVAAGAVTANSRRTLYARASRRISTTNTLLDQVVWRTVDTNTAGEYLIADGNAFFALAGWTIDIEALWSHANAASNVSVTTGAKLTCYFLGSGVTIGSA